MPANKAYVLLCDYQDCAEVAVELPEDGTCWCAEHFGRRTQAPRNTPMKVRVKGVEEVALPFKFSIGISGR